MKHQTQQCIQLPHSPCFCYGILKISILGLAEMLQTLYSLTTEFTQREKCVSWVSLVEGDDPGTTSFAPASLLSLCSPGSSRSTGGCRCSTHDKPNADSTVPGTADSVMFAVLPSQTRASSPATTTQPACQQLYHRQSCDPHCQRERERGVEIQDPRSHPGWADWMVFTHMYLFIDNISRPPEAPHRPPPPQPHACIYEAS